MHDNGRYVKSGRSSPQGVRAPSSPRPELNTSPLHLPHTRDQVVLRRVQVDLGSGNRGVAGKLACRDKSPVCRFSSSIAEWRSSCIGSAAHRRARGSEPTSCEPPVETSSAHAPFRVEQDSSAPRASPATAEPTSYRTRAQMPRPPHTCPCALIEARSNATPHFFESRAGHPALRGAARTTLRKAEKK